MYFSGRKKDTNIDSEFESEKKSKLNFNFNFDFLKNKRNQYISIALGAFLLIILLIIILPKGANKFLVLNGNTDIVIYQSSDYVDPGYLAYDKNGNDLSTDVIIDGFVDTEVAGEYEIKYKLNNIVKIRTVTVLSNDNNHVTYLMLHGDKIMYLKQGEKYIDPGYTVIDSSTPNLVNNVVIDGYVDTNVTGTYKLTYSVTNDLGVKLTDTRVVIVLGTSDISISYTPLTYTSGSVTIHIGVVSNYFDYVVLPNGKKSNLQNTTYLVGENGTYTFLFYDRDGTSREKSITINNIDRIPPNGTCSGYYQNGNSYVTVSAADDYTDVIKFESSGQTFNKRTVTLDREYSNLSMLIYDEAGNSSIISCNLTNKNSIKSFNYVRCRDDIIYHGTKYSLTTSQKQKLAAMAYGEDSYSLTGLRAVVSHMANLYESKRWHGFIKSSLSFYDYISTTTWYSANTRNRKYNASKMSYIIPIIDDVLVKGNRTIPLYIDEFDLFPNDVKKTKNTGTYVQGKSKYNNIYGAKNVTFWCFSLNGKGTSGNIYGYSSSAYKNYVSK